MQFNERVLKIIDTFEGGSKSRFATRTGMQNQVYNVLKPEYKPGKITTDRIISAYPNISVEWLTSDTGEMTTENTTVQHTELPDNSTVQEVLSFIQKHSGSNSLPALSVKLNVSLNDLNKVYSGQKTMGGKLAQIIHEKYPELPYHWIKTGKNPSGKSQSSPKKKNKVKQDTFKPQIQTPVNESAPIQPVQPLESTDNKSYIQVLELQVQSLLLINEGILSGYQKVIEANKLLNNTIIELADKVLSLHKH
ncbi:MAG: hypothetical protein LBL33_07795 [Tannerella sp.]|jgi:hypothetical protein|nr:hypothetical protein [Tannerella sp.]